MKKFIKNNWFKLIIAICVVTITIGWLRHDRYYFMSVDDAFYKKCNKNSGECSGMIPKVSRLDNIFK